MISTLFAGLALTALGTSDIVNFPVGTRVLFQGDSITDGNRGRNEDPNHILGHGYAFVIAAASGAARPEKNYVFLNRGISGNKISDLAARWSADTLALKPDVLSILVGINDVEGGTSIQDFELQYDALLSQTQTALPNVRLVLLEPFGLPSGWRKATWDTRAGRLKAIQLVVAKLAKNHEATFVPLQKVFDEATKRAPAEYWIWDGVHPTYSGHQLLADAWVRAVSKR